MRRMTVFSILLFVLLLLLLPIFFTQLMAGSLVKLHLSPQTAMDLTIAIILGGLVNIPVARLDSSEAAVVDPFAIFGLSGFFQRTTRQSVIAINIGGCLIPAAIAIYELVQLHGAGARLVDAAAFASLANIVVCYASARIVPGVGITMPGFVAPLVAALCAYFLAPGAAPPVAFVAGVAGPLIGADLLHLKDVRAGPVGIVSIGGAGTFDGIVLSGIIAAYLA